METKKAFKMSLAQPELMRDSIKVLPGLLNEARLHISNDGLKITEMDPANVAMAIWHLLPSSCLEYELEEEKSLLPENAQTGIRHYKEITIGINLENFLNILKNAKKSDII